VLACGDIVHYYLQPGWRDQSARSGTLRRVSLNSWAILIAVIGAGFELVGLWMVVREIAGDRRRARLLLDKERSWRPKPPTPARRVMPHQVERGPAISTTMQRSLESHVAQSLASLVTAHNQLVHDLDAAIDGRTDQLLKEIDSGDNALRDVLRELLRGSIVERLAGVVAIGIGITLSATASVLSSLG
jgi:hypothetical protein